jgi:hypothetical protein
MRSKKKARPDLKCGEFGENSVEEDDETLPSKGKETESTMRGTINVKLKVNLARKLHFCKFGCIVNSRLARGSFNPQAAGCNKTLRQG